MGYDRQVNQFWQVIAHARKNMRDYPRRYEKVKMREIGCTTPYPAERVELRDPLVPVEPGNFQVANSSQSSVMFRFLQGIKVDNTPEVMGVVCELSPKPADMRQSH